MRERKYIKLKVNMYDDTKFKIIDMKPERDLIHYIWTRFIALAGKVNLEGKLYMSKNIPYTIETLAIEFNRGAYQVKLALDVFVELEMIELTEDNVYIVKNFAKHQNIKVKETIKSKDKEEDIKIKEVEAKENFENEIYDNEDKQSENKTSQIYDNKAEESKNKISENKVEDVKDNRYDNLEIKNKDIKKIENRDISKIDNKDSNNKLEDNMPIVLEEKKKKRANKNKKNTISFDDMEEENEDNKMFEFCDADEENEDNEIFELCDADEGRALKEGESVVMAWSF